MQFMEGGVTGRRGVPAPCLVAEVSGNGCATVTPPLPATEGVTALARTNRSHTATRKLVLVSLTVLDACTATRKLVLVSLTVLDACTATRKLVLVSLTVLDACTATRKLVLVSLTVLDACTATRKLSW